ncbi:MAG: DUF255 domain-containing protein, partial [Betaproteobacteria bacterium]|nr:DUF255 domain-containing protein [Betaproteobacteria bacterium]
AYTNRLIDSHDPYLLLHAHNPVDWYPWGDEALEKARRENKPIFVSIGYSTCYWCHVAEREIYSNPQIAALMNQWFVNIKIDREERPDLDNIYIQATQVMTGHSGWPNNVFLTPELKPFFAGSYFPPDDQNGRPGFTKILTRLHQAWSDDHDQVVAAAERVYQKLRQPTPGSSTSANKPPATEKWLDQAVRESAASFDDIDGGFGSGAAKFPKSPQLSMLLGAYTLAPGRQPKALAMATATLEAMAEGGVMDQLGAGFHRYSTEPSWSIPHFEKMLYDNAQLLGIYAQAYAITKTPLFRQVALRTADYLSREMQAPDGGFYSAQDAEVNGVEGASYLWTREQIKSILGAADAQRFFALYTLTPMPEAPAGQQQPAGGALRVKAGGTPSLAQNQRLTTEIETLAPLRDKLLAARQARVQPKRDEKIVIADNALAVIGFAQAGQALHVTAFTQTAQRTADWLWQQAYDPKSGELKHQFFRGHAADRGFLDDYALLGQAYLTLYRTTGDGRWRSRARQVADAMLRRFAQPDGVLLTSWDTTNLLLAPPADGDSVKPSGQSAAIALLLGLAAGTHQAQYAVAARKALVPLSRPIEDDASGWGSLLAALSQPTLRRALDGVRNAVTSTAAPTAKSPDTADHVHAKGRWLASNKGATLALTIKIDNGYHINANPASAPYLVATQLQIDGYPNVKVDYPAAQNFKAPFAPQGIAVYQGRVTLTAHLPPGLRPSAANLRVQACNDEVCLAPATITVPLSSK